MNALRMTHETRPCRMLEGIPLHRLLNAVNQRTAERIQREAQARAFSDSDLTDGEQVFGKAVES